MEQSVEEYLEYNIVSVVNADLEAWEDSPIFNYNSLSEAKSWGLDKVFDEIIYKPSRTVEALEASIKWMEEFIKTKASESFGLRDLITSEIQKTKAEIQSLREKSNT